MTAKQLHYRLALERADYTQAAIPLDEYYTASADVFSSRDKAWYWSLVSGTALFLYKVGVLTGFSLPHIQVDKEVIGFALLALYSGLTLAFSFAQAKVYRYLSLFEAVSNASNAAGKQDLLLRYPRMFSAMLYSNWLSARPHLMFPKRNFPKRLTILLVLLLPVIVFWLVFILWLLVSVSVDLWMYEAKFLGSWGRVIVVLSWLLFAFAALLPTLSFRKIYFEHHGLSQLLIRYEKRSKSRYLHFLNRIYETEEGKAALSKDSN